MAQFFCVSQYFAHCCCFRDTLIINVISFFTSIYAGVAVFAIIGYMAIEYDLPVNCVINSGEL